MTRAIDKLRATDWKPLIEEQYVKYLPLYKVSEVPPDVDGKVRSTVLGGDYVIDKLLLKHYGEDSAAAHILMKAKAVALYAARILLIDGSGELFPKYRRAEEGIPVVVKGSTYTVDGKEYPNFDDRGQKFVKSNFFIARDPRVWFGPLEVEFINSPDAHYVGVKAETVVSYEVL